MLPDEAFILQLFSPAPEILFEVRDLYVQSCFPFLLYSPFPKHIFRYSEEKDKTAKYRWIVKRTCPSGTS